MSSRTPGGERIATVDNALTPAEAMGLLADERRQRVVRHLSLAREPVSLEDLVSELAPSGRARSEASADQTRAVLHHVHLPKLAAHGLLTYDVERGLVSPGDLAAIDPYLRCIDAGR